MNISKTTLVTRHLQAMKNFYIDQIGFPLVSKTNESFTMQIGTDQLTYRQTDDVDTQYHMAFNIPENVFQEGKAWLEARTPLLIEDGQDEIYFDFTDSHSCYFYDPDENVLELIARHQINPTKEDQTFDVSDILGIGEMSLTVKDVLAVGEQLADIGVLERRERPLNGASLNFLGPVADGTHILLVPEGRTWLFSPKIAKVSPIEMELDGRHRVRLDANGVWHQSAVSS